MSEPTVEIVIPTFDRPELLGAAVRSALEELPFAVTVLDDCSAVPAVEVVDVDSLNHDFGGRLRVLRNVTNLGAHLNILRSLEVSRAAYTWPFSDDLVVAADAAERILAGIAEHPGAAVHCWNPALEETHHSVETAATFVALVERHRHVYGMSDLHFNRVVRTDLGLRYYRLDATFGQTQPMHPLLLAALSDGHEVVLHGGTLGRPRGSNQHWWNEAFLGRFKLDPGYALKDPDLRRRYRAVVARDLAWRRALIEAAVRAPDSDGVFFMHDAASLVSGSPLPAKLRAEAWLARRVASSALLRAVYRRLRPPTPEGEEPTFSERGS